MLYMSRDLREFDKQTNRQLIIGGTILLFVVGDGLIYLFYGTNAALFGLLCIGAGLLPILAIWLVLYLMDRFVKSQNPERSIKILSVFCFCLKAPLKTLKNGPFTGLNSAQVATIRSFQSFKAPFSTKKLQLSIIHPSGQA